MARYRANTVPGETAYVGNLRFGPGQLLPAGTVEYQINGFFALDPDEGQPAGVAGIPYSITVPVGTSRLRIDEVIETLVQVAIEEGDANAYPDLTYLASLWGLTG